MKSVNSIPIQIVFLLVLRCVTSEFLSICWFSIYFVLPIVIFDFTVFFISKQDIRKNKEKELVVITGCSTGIGRSCTFKYLEEGFHVVSTVRKDEDGIQLKKDAEKHMKDNSKLTVVICDVTNSETITDLVNVTTDILESKDLHFCSLINNAGMASVGPIELVEAEDIEYNFKVNLFGLIDTTKKFLPLMRAHASKENDVRIINVSSGLAFFTLPSLSIYCSTKHALNAICDGFRSELANFNIKTISFNPGEVRTDFRKNSFFRQKKIT
eukprot:TRINITY_DN2809_c0_g1_i1.p1 TRINITY_DN2809_c0_g1~~TRINITY_DN2809_c0_g1_i1.p1  ORF type:complete len:269 (-),score=63.74 TRINITY_DN2809_c0_g1_i1:455-1261(-)